MVWLPNMALVDINALVHLATLPLWLNPFQPALLTLMVLLTTCTCGYIAFLVLSTLAGFDDSDGIADYLPTWSHCLSGMIYSSWFCWLC